MDPPGAQLLAEGSITAQLQHPGIAPVYGLGVDAVGHPFCATRLVQGETLREAIEELLTNPAPGA